MQRIWITEGPTREEVILAKKGNKMTFRHKDGDLNVGFVGATISPDKIGYNIIVMLEGQECNGHYNHLSRKGYLDCPAVATAS